MLFYFAICAAIPLIICLHSFQPFDKRVKKNRLIHSIPSILVTLFNISIIGYTIFVGKIENIEFLKENQYIYTAAPIVLVVFCLIVYSSGKRKEQYLNADLIATSVEKVRFQKRSDRSAFDIDTENEDSDSGNGGK